MNNEDRNFLEALDEAIRFPNNENFHHFRSKLLAMLQVNRDRLKQEAFREQREEQFDDECGHWGAGRDNYGSL